MTARGMEMSDETFRGGRWKKRPQVMSDVCRNTEQRPRLTIQSLPLSWPSGSTRNGPTQLLGRSECFVTTWTKTWQDCKFPFISWASKTHCQNHGVLLPEFLEGLECCGDAQKHLRTFLQSSELQELKGLRATGLGEHFSAPTSFKEAAKHRTTLWKTILDFMITDDHCKLFLRFGSLEWTIGSGALRFSDTFWPRRAIWSQESFWLDPSNSKRCKKSRRNFDQGRDVFLIYGQYWDVLQYIFFTTICRFFFFVCVFFVCKLKTISCFLMVAFLMLPMLGDRQKNHAGQAWSHHE